MQDDSKTVSHSPSGSPISGADCERSVDLKTVGGDPVSSIANLNKGDKIDVINVALFQLALSRFNEMLRMEVDLNDLVVHRFQKIRAPS